MTIPIAINSKSAEPEKGKFRRLGLDVAVNATWLAMKWALDDGNKEAEDALEKLMLDWQFDFHLFEGTAEDVEEKIMKHIINLPAATERLRDFCGLDTGNLMRIAGEVQDLLKNQSQSKATPSPEKVHQWMVNPDNIRWGVYHVPSLRTIKDMLKNWDSIRKSPTVLAIIDNAKSYFGRDNLFDFPIKVGVIMDKAGQDPQLVRYVFESLFALMMRKKTKDPLGAAEIKGKTGEVDSILWQRRYIIQLTKDYPKMFEVAESAAPTQLQNVQKMKALIESPLAMYELMDGADRDLTFSQSLQNGPIRMFFKHLQDVFAGFYSPEVKGALSGSTGQKYDWAMFHEGVRVKKRFLSDFTIAYDSLWKKMPQEETEQEAKEEKKEKAKEEEKVNIKKPDKSVLLQLFQQDAEATVATEIDARLVCLTADGTHPELTREKVSSTRLYNNMSENEKFMGFFDVKNAKLLDRREDESIVQREPLLDMDQFDSFCAVTNKLMQPNRDLVWILLGKSDSAFIKIKKKVMELGWKDKCLHLVYSRALIQKWYVKRMRGMANNRTYERLLICWIGRFPTGTPKERQYVDAGSAVYEDTMLKVPVLHPKDLTYVEKDVLEQSLRSMIGLSEETRPDAADPQVTDLTVTDSAADVRPLLENLKKRRLYRRATGESVVWFPHDNHPDLLKELIWESGNPRWILHGTPASGAGVMGCLEMGVSVIA